MNIDMIFDEARRLDCSDIHFTVGMPPIVRSMGQLHKLGAYPVMTEYNILQVCEAIASDRDKLLIREHMDVDFTFVSKSGLRHRVNVFRQRNNTAIAVRLLRDKIPTLKDLNLPSLLGDFAMKPRGIVLVTGPTGSGKSTTLAAMIDCINTAKNCHIITIEDPIEYVHQHKSAMINQRQVGEDVPDFASALRSALREDPDVILVGEMRDYETINAAITAAETGHLVLSTLHTTDSASTIDRIIDVFPGHQQKQIRTQLASVLVGIVGQTLIPKTDNSGRIASLEIMIATDSIKAMIRDDKIHLIPSAIQTNKQIGMRLRDQDLARLVKEKTISIENALERCTNADELHRYIRST